MLAARPAPRLSPRKTSAEKALDQRDPMILAIQISPVFDRLRSDQRYSVILHKMNLA
jgi:hypothetical protein